MTGQKRKDREDSGEPSPRRPKPDLHGLMARLERERKKEREERLIEFLERHRTEVTDKRLGLHAYQDSRLLHYDVDRERGLFEEKGCEHPVWRRCHYTKTKRMNVETEHVEGCTGFAPEREKPLFFVGRHLMRCACPVRVEFKEFVWMVCPKFIKIKDKEGEEEVGNLKVADGEDYRL